MRHKVLPLIKHLSSTFSHSAHSSPRVDDGLFTNYSTPKSNFSLQSPSDSLYSTRDPFEPSSTQTTPLRPRITLKKRAQISPNEACCFCLEPVTICFDGEEFIQLTCGHFIHFDCLVELRESEKEETVYSPKEELAEVDAEASFSVVCPLCTKDVSCTSGELEDKLLKIKLLNTAKAWVSADLPTETVTPTTANFNASEIPEMHSSVSSSSFTPLRTPENQIGDRFWDSMKEQVITTPQMSSDSLQKPSSATIPLFAEKSSLCLPSPSTADSTASLSNPKLFKVSLNPEETCISLGNISERDSNEYILSSVVNVKTAAFEPLPVNQPKGEKIITDVNKSKILNSLLDVLKLRLSEDDLQKLDIVNLGSLVLFDYMNSISYTGVSYHWPLIILFEFALVVLSSEANEVILAQKLDRGDIISSVYANHNNDTILINTSTLQLPEIRLETDGKVILQKWTNVLKHFVNNSQLEISDETNSHYIPSAEYKGINFESNSPGDYVPCVLMSTNAWSLIPDGDNSIPDDILKINKLESSGLELPFEYVNKRLSKPDSTPLKLILVLPMVNNKDSGSTKGEYANNICQAITGVLDRLEDHDEIGLVFIGQRTSEDNYLGHYYGMVGRKWSGWRNVLDSINAESVSDHKEGTLQWSEGLKYVNTLLRVGFEKNDNMIRHLIFVTTEVIKDPCFSIQDFMVCQHEIKNPFSETPQRNKAFVPIHTAITQVCSKYHTSFSSILMADEFKYSLTQYAINHQALNNLSAEEGYNNWLREYLVLDVSDLKNTIGKILEKLSNATVRSIDISLATPSGVELREFEFNGEMTKLRSDSSFRIHLINLESGYNECLMFKVAINLDRLDHKILEKGGKVSIAVAKTSMQTLQSTTDVNTISPLDIRVMPAGKNINATPLNLTIRNSYDIRDVELPIVSGLKSVKDIYFIKREMQLSVIEVLKNVVFCTTKFDHARKETIIVQLTGLVNELEKSADAFNHSSTSIMDIEKFKSRVSSLTELLEECKDGYSLRNYQLSNYKFFNYYLQTI